LLGLAGSDYCSKSICLDKGDTVVAYTDGLVEHRSWGLDEAFAHLADELGRRAGEDVQALCDALVAIGRGGRPQEDDVCVLVLRYQG
jgi:serine phosphatase RsbU (regulator of sigma subunit)